MIMYKAKQRPGTKKRYILRDSRPADLEMKLCSQDVIEGCFRGEKELWVLA